MKCHLCDLESRQLNGFMSRHYKTHVTDIYTREDYLASLLEANGKPPNHCPVCGKRTKYSREEASWDKYCSRECFYESTKGKGNPNYKGGMTITVCANCEKTIERHPSQLPNDKTFCSISCSTTYYSRPENISEKRIEGMRVNREKSKQRWQDEEYRTKMARSMAETFKDHTSQVERDCFEAVKRLYPDARPQEVIGYYAFDIFIPSLSLAIEFDGTYWHGPLNPQYGYQDTLDRRKTTYLKNNRPDVALVRVKETCWNLAKNKEEYLQKLITNRRRVVLVSGPSGSGKSWVCRQVQKFPVVMWDKCKDSEDFLKAIDEANSSVVVAEIPMMVSTHVKKLTHLGYWVDMVCVTESVETVRERLEQRGGHITDSVVARIKRFASLSNRATFFGTSMEVLAWLSRWDIV